MLKRIHLLIALLACTSLSAGAQTTMREAWLSMPDSLIPYLNRNLRMEHVDFIDMGVRSEVKNLMNGECVMDTLTDAYTHVTLNESLSMEMRLLPMGDSAQIVCLVKTFRAPLEESSVTFYDTSWNPLPDAYGIDEMKNADVDEAQANALLERFVHRPDTMPQERFAELKKLIDPVMVAATLSIGEDVITFSLSAPLATSKEREALKAILLQRKFKWVAGKFNEI